MRALRYLTAMIIPFLVWLGLYTQSWWAIVMTPAIVFGIIPLLELVFPAPTTNLSEDEEYDARTSRVYDVIVYSMVPIQFALLGYYLHVVTRPEETWWLFAGHTITMGISCGVLGINVGHELGHRRRRYEQNMAKALLLTSLYMHFFIEHNRGHHVRVATEQDPATSRLGETVYAFILRSAVGGWMSAWELEEGRLRTLGRPVWSLHNQMLRFQLIQVAFVAAIALVWGPVGALGFVLAALGGGALLEVVNYIEHYGLQRREVAPGRFERVLPIHSWNSNHVLGRLLLFELSRHSDHHANARRRYQVLRHFDESPQFPTGYPGMLVLAAIPPLWFRVMHRHIDRHRQQLGMAPLNGSAAPACASPGDEAMAAS
jgi:alkane 1-monooxygenase